MKALDKINHDFTFIVLEVNRQLKDAAQYVLQPDARLLEDIISRDDYIDNLKGRIEDSCFSVNLRSSSRPQRAVQINALRAVNIIAANLERIADHAVNIVDQMQYLTDADVLPDFSIKPAFREIQNALALVEKAFTGKSIELAMQICHCEQTLDDLYTETFHRIIEQIQAGLPVESRITVLFIMHYLERMGDAMLNIGEAVIFAVMGQKLKVHQYTALKDSLSSTDMPTDIGDVAFESIWGTRSGCRIGHVRNMRRDSDAQRVIFKKGGCKKLESERSNIELWQEILPGLPPAVMNFQKNGRHATMLLQYLGNATFQHMILNESDSLFEESFLAIQRTMQQVWKTTMETKPSRASFSRQLLARLHDVFSVHPTFKVPPKQIGTVQVQSFDERIKITRTLDRELSAPFSVFAHGDFNIDNIIYDPRAGSVHFIDLHRSCRTDFVQDVSVFLVSNFRQPIFEPRLRHRLNTVIQSFYRFAHNFADLHGDTHFDARLALGIARSLITSTRFELNTKFAHDMFLRSMYLLDRLSEHPPAPWDSFVLPPDTLIA